MFNSNSYHIIGDSAFPLKPWLIPPYKKPRNGQLSRSQKRFNKKFTQTRIPVEHAFGDLKNRFRRCQDVKATIEHAVDIVVSSCVLHNICIQKGDILHATRNAVLHCNVNPNDIVGGRNDGANHDVGYQKREQIRRGFEPRNVIAFARR